jgi:hypothetical protein
MKARIRRHLGSLRANAYVVLWSWDFAIAVLVFVGLSIAAMEDALPKENPEAAFLAIAGLAVGLLAASLGAIQLFVTFLDKYYRRVLEQSAGGVANALVPFQFVALLSGATAVLAILATFLWPRLSDDLRTLALVVVPASFAWVVAGTVQLVFLSSWHGLKRSELLRAIDDVGQELRRRKAERRRPDRPAGHSRGRERLKDD